MKIASIVLPALALAVSITSCVYIIETGAPAPIIDLYTIPMVEGKITCTTANENNCLNTTKE